MQLPVRGCRDVLPAAAVVRRSIVERFADLAGRYGFAEVETPLLESNDLFVSALGETSDVVTSELFQVTGTPGGLKYSRDERSRIVLRPEGTAGVARAFGSKVRSGSCPSRLWYAGPMFRYERPQRLRLRQFYQVGVECLGETSIHADVDTICLASEFIGETPGGKNSSLVINCLGTKEDREKYNDALHEWLKSRLQSLSPVSRHRHAAGRCMRILDSKLSEDQDALNGAPLMSEFVGEREKGRFEGLQHLLRAEGVPFALDPKLVRGLDYYSSTAFEFIDSSGRAVCAGGRYEALHGTNGVGFAAGLERLEIDDGGSLDDPATTVDTSTCRNGVVVLALTSSTNMREDSVGRRFVRELRSVGIRANITSVASKVSKAVGRAVKNGAFAVVVIGEDEVQRDVLQLKLVGGSSHDVRNPQRALRPDEAFALIKDHFDQTMNKSV